MRDITAEIARFLRGEGFCAFADALPERPDEAIAVLETGGGIDGGVFTRRIQVRVRAKGRVKAFTMADAAFSLLLGMDESQVLLEAGPCFVVPEHAPAMIERDSRLRPVFGWTARVLE